MVIKRKTKTSPVRGIVAAFIACLLLYIYTFHVPYTVMLASETLDSYSETVCSYDEDGKETFSAEYYVDTPVRDGNGNVIAVINKADLVSILRDTLSVRELNTLMTYSSDDVLYELHLNTSRGVLHVIIGQENSFWYRSGDDFFTHAIVDSETVYDHITETMLPVSTFNQFIFPYRAANQ